MNIKKICTVLIALISSISVAEVNTYRTDNYTAWKVLKSNVKHQYVEVVSVDKLKPDLLRPICVDGNKMIFKYEMMGEDDSFYDINSQAINVKSLNTTIYRSVVFALKIDVEQDNDLNGRLDEEYNNICTKNKAQRYIAPQMRTSNGIDSHGVIKYIGDITIQPPF